MTGLRARATEEDVAREEPRDQETKMKLLESNLVKVHVRGRHRVVTLEGRELGVYWKARQRAGYRLRVGNVMLKGRCLSVERAVRCIVDWSLGGKLPPLIQRTVA